jgi:hypothetical protein
MIKTPVRALIICAALSALAACGNDLQARRGADTVKELALLMKTRLSKQDETVQAEAPDPVVMIDNALKLIPDAPLQFILLEKTGAFAVTSIFGTNGSKVTWISPDRKTLTLDRGMLVATRGLLGGDIMSVEDGGAAHLISSRQSGTVVKTYRYLNREERISRLPMTCAIARGAEAPVQSGVITAQTILMTEHCQTKGGEFEFTNSYWVDSAGRTIQSVQWISGQAGKVVFRRLRH